MKVRVNLRQICVFMFQCAYIANVVLGSDPSLYIIPKALIVAYWGIMALYIAGNLNYKVQIGPGILMMTCFTLLCAASYLWAADKIAAEAQMATQWQLFLLFLFTYYLIRQDGDVEPYFKAIYAAGFVLLLYTIFRYGITGFFAQMRAGIRMGGEIGNENEFGMAFSEALIIAYYYFLRNHKRIHLASIAVFVVFALSSGSKKAILMSAVGVIGLSALHYGFRRIWKTLLALLAVALAGFILLQLPLFSVIRNRLTSYFSGDLNISDMHRMAFIETGLRMIAERPLFGYGLSNFASISGIGTYSHNNFIEVAVSTGCVGFVIYYGSFAFAAWKLFKGFIHRKDMKTVVLLVFIIINFVFGYGMVQFYSKGPWMFLAVMLAVSDGYRTKGRVKKDVCDQKTS